MESGKSKINAPADSASGSEMAFSLCLHLVEGTRELSGVIFRRAINSFIRDLLSWINHLPKGSVHQYNHIEVQDFNIWIYKGDTFSLGLSWRCSGKESTCQCRKWLYGPWMGKILWRRKWQPTPVFFPEKSHGQRSLVGYTPWGHKETQLSNWTH